MVTGESEIDIGEDIIAKKRNRLCSIKNICAE